jgi:beta-fructofuranosidase
MLLHFKPTDGHVADVIPFYWEGVYHAFYLKRRPGRGTPYAHVVSRDLVQWEEMPDALETGAPGEPDHDNCFTGSIIEREGVFYLFYTGHTPNNPPLPCETICLATSHDLITWQKDPANPILQADERWYERDDWRDPYVFWNAQEECYWMLLCARQKDSATPRRGCIGLATSPDLVSWQVQPPLWSPGIVYAPECPDLFHSHDHWFLLFSTIETRYRYFDLWSAPLQFASATDALDTPRFYAAKAFHAGDRHLLAGWVSSNAGETDSGGWEWGGTMGLLRELVPTSDGHLWVQCPEEVRRAFRQVALGPDKYPLLQPVTGNWECRGEKIVGSSPDGMALALFPDVPADYRLSATLTLSGPVATGGLMLRLPAKLDGGYQLALEPARQRALVRNWATWGDSAPTVERPLPLYPDRPLRIEAYVRGSILEVFFEDRVALTTRIYNFAQGALGLFATNGQILIENLEISITD